MEWHAAMLIEHNLEVIKTADWLIDLGPRAATAAARSWRKARPRTWSR
jgi:excinuclease ABC subunit A